MKPIPTVAALKPGQYADIPDSELAELEGDLADPMTAAKRVLFNLVRKDITLQAYPGGVRFERSKP